LKNTEILQPWLEKPRAARREVGGVLCRSHAAFAYNFVH